MSDVELQAVGPDAASPSGRSDASGKASSSPPPQGNGGALAFLTEHRAVLVCMAFLLVHIILVAALTAPLRSDVDDLKDSGFQGGAAGRQKSCYRCCSPS